MNLLLQLALGLALVSTIFPACGSEIPGPDSVQTLTRFVRTANGLAFASERERAEFASIALAEMAVSYVAEADLARHQSSELKRGNKLGSWSAGVYDFVDRLVLFQENIDLGLPVEFRHLHGQVVGVVSGGHMVILSHPRHAEQAAYEQRVLADFCGRHDCERLTTFAPGEDQTPIPVTATAALPEWEFQQTGAVCSHRGINVRFSNREQLATRRGICQQLMQEAESLATELAWEQRHGVPIDWGGLLIRSTRERPEHIIQLNRSGDSILVALPLIYSTKGLLAQLMPWLQARYEAEDELVYLELEAASMGWE